MTDLGLFMAPRNIYFVEPGSSVDSTRIFSLDQQPLPKGWTRQRKTGHAWTGVYGPQKLPSQGWKLHISARLDDADEVLNLVANSCLEHGISFKYLATPEVLSSLNRKYSPRSSSGKFITVYPINSESFGHIADELCVILRGREAPTILTDIQLGSAPVYGRYGAFREMWIGLPSGEDALALHTPDGTLVTDSRHLRFDVPQDITDIPPIIERALQQRTRQAQKRKIPYQVDRALHFSNAGGVYQARSEDGTPVVIKEGRRHTGMGLDGRDAAEGLRSEATALRALSGISGVPRYIDWHSFADREFLVEEHLGGSRSIEYVASNHPDMYAQSDSNHFRRYAKTVQKVIDNLQAVVDAIHERGWSFGDLHPGNLLIDASNDVSLVDFETATCDPSDKGDRFTVAPGFRVNGLSAQAADHRRVQLIHLWMLIPAGTFWEFSDKILLRYIEEATKKFSLNPSIFADLIRSLQPAHSESYWKSRVTLPDPCPVDEVIEKATKDILRFITEDSVMLKASPIPVGPGRVSWNVGQGAAGVLWMLQNTPDPRVQDLAQWVQTSAMSSPRVLPGLYSGDAGVAVTLAAAGRTTAGDWFLDRALARANSLDHAGLEAGLSGIAWAALCLGRREEALGLAERAVNMMRTSTHGRGLLIGPSGVSLLASRLFEFTGDSGWLDVAEDMLQLDLHHLVYREDGTVLLDVGNGKHQPDIGQGSLGTAIAAERILLYRNNDGAYRLRESAGRSCLSGSWATQGLLDGRSGAVAYLATLNQRNVEENLLLQTNTKVLLEHFIDIDGSLHFPGRLQLRFSHDLSSGMAGALHALSLLSNPSRGPVPLLDLSHTVLHLSNVTQEEMELHL